MKYIIELRSADTPPAHSNPVIGLSRERGGAYVCWYAEDAWHTATGWPDDLAWWFEIPLIGNPVSYSEE